MLAILDFYYIIGLVGLWLVLFMPASYRALRALGWKGVSTVAGYLLPLPLTATLLIAAWVSHVPLVAKLELSEGALIAYAEKFDSRHPDAYHDFRFIGLFRVEHVHESGGCTVFATTGFGVEDEGGLAYCTGPNPTCHGLDMDHIKGQWWIWSVNQSVC